MRYNAATHSIESKSGVLLATLSAAVSVSDAWKVADNWGGFLDQEKLDEALDELSDLRRENASLAGEAEDLESEVDDLCSDLRAHKSRVEDLENQLEELGVSGVLGADEEG